MRRSPGVDQGHAMSGALQMDRGPGAKHAGADDRDMFAHARHSERQKFTGG